MEPKSTHSLMSYIRDKKEIQINEALQKRELRFMGYFHGYKGYRYFNSPQHAFHFKDFSELQAIYEFDMSVKSIFYPKIMFLETTLKNFALEVILEKAHSNQFSNIYNKLLTNYKAYPIGSSQYKKLIIKRMHLRNKIYHIISRDYGKRLLVNHYYDKNQPLPIWAIFELLSLGEFGNLISCLNLEVRKEISKSIGIKSSANSDGKLVEMLIYILKDLRNAVVHNNPIFDTRFKTGEINHRIASYISTETGITNITFNTIIDYLILICFLLKLLEYNTPDIIVFIQEFVKICENLRQSVPINIYSTILHTDTKQKISTLKSFL